MLKRILAIALFVLTLILIGCGGGGGGGTSGGGSGGTFGSIRVEAVNGAGQYINPNNIQVGDHVTFQLAHYSTTTQARQAVSISGVWSTDDFGSQAGALAGGGGYNALSPSATTYHATATASSDGNVYSASYNVLSARASVRGRLVDTNGFGAPGVEIDFLNGSGTQVGSTVTSGDGSIYAAVPTTATRFQLKASTINPTFYYSSFSYNAFRYSPLIPGCSAPLPALTNGVTSNLSANVILDAKTSSGGLPNPPPPPPTGCGP